MPSSASRDRRPSGIVKPTSKRPPAASSSADVLERRRARSGRFRRSRARGTASPSTRQRVRRAVGVDEPQAHRRARERRAPRRRRVVAIEGRDAVEGVGDESSRRRRTSTRPCGSMTKAPKSPRRTSFEATWCVWYQNVPTCVGAEAVDVALAREHGVLGHTGDAVLRVRDVDAVPVDRDALVDVLVRERHLDEVALLDAQLRAGRACRRRSGRRRSRPDASRIVACRAVSVNRASASARRARGDRRRRSRCRATRARARPLRGRRRSRGSP